MSALRQRCALDPLKLHENCLAALRSARREPVLVRVSRIEAAFVDAALAASYFVEGAEVKAGRQELPAVPGARRDSGVPAENCDRGNRSASCRASRACDAAQGAVGRPAALRLRSPRPLRMLAVMDATAWSSLEVAKLAAAVATPVAVVLLGIFVNNRIKRLEDAQWTRRTLIERRMKIYDGM